MAKADIKNILYSKEKSPLEFHFDSLMAPPILSILDFNDITALNNIATSLRYSGNIEKKHKTIIEIMKRRDLLKFATGTNRMVFKFLHDNTILIKTAVDMEGLSDSPSEFINQSFLKPLVTKTFDVTPCGTVGLFERVEPITSIEEFMSIAPNIFDMLTNCFIGKYILNDIGTKYFLNYGLRNGFGPVLLDYPYVFKLDGNKLYCNNKVPRANLTCGGLIDYDDGFNNLICTKCGKIYRAKDLKSNEKNNIIIRPDKGGENPMKVMLVKGDTVIKEVNKNSDYISRDASTSGPKAKLQSGPAGKKNNYNKRNHSNSSDMPKASVHVPEKKTATGKMQDRIDEIKTAIKPSSDIRESKSAVVDVSNVEIEYLKENDAQEDVSVEEETVNEVDATLEEEAKEEKPKMSMRDRLKMDSALDDEY